MGHLLDANALIALCWPAHEHHEVMVAWFKKNARRGWATCALTQAALVRISLQPAFAGRSITVADVAALLTQNTAHSQHEFLPLDFEFETVRKQCTGGLWGHRQITDAWLLTAAIRHGHKLLTLDRGLSALLATDQERKAHVVALGA
jgi:uncharacterized protein